MYKRILLAYDGSDAGQRALLDSQELAQWSKAELALAAVMPPNIPLAGIEGTVYDFAAESLDRARYEEILRDGLRRLEQAGHSARGEILVGEPVSAITSHASSIGADLIVVGHKHLDSWAARWWRGSVSGALIEHARCSVFLAITQ